jgi:histidyl-tRNA synthetase
MLDTLPPDSARWNDFENRCRALFARYGYQEIRTPVVEPTALFSRGIGEATDIVEKEMYTFEDRKGRSLTMRPEMTASCVRAFIQHGIARLEPVTRWMYSGPMFRYERMQGGRYRQFYQVGVEAFGAPEPTVEAEQIAMLCALYESLGMRQSRELDHAQGELCVVINSVGGSDDRPRYRAALVEHLAPHARELCADCQRRLHTNPLRVLDCKLDGEREIIRSAPSIVDFLGDASRAHFEATQAALTDLGVTFRVDAKMVRGLDYYTGPVFEIVAHSDELGRRSTIVAGGRYDNLVESLGGPPTPAAGFSIGTERNIFYHLKDALAGPPQVDAMIAVHGDAARARGIALAHELRRAGLHVEIDHRSVGMKAQFKRADKLGARRVIAIGETELAEGVVTVRDMTARTETKVALSDLAVALR